MRYTAAVETQTARRAIRVCQPDEAYAAWQAVHRAAGPGAWAEETGSRQPDGVSE